MTASNLPSLRHRSGWRIRCLLGSCQGLGDCLRVWIPGTAGERVYVANVNRHILLSGLVSALLMFNSSFREPGLGPLSLVGFILGLEVETLGSQCFFYTL